ncbi:MAG: hypoxanthine-guanine phosphoribosyltransferase [Methylococcaceae bacterium]
MNFLNEFQQVQKTAQLLYDAPTLEAALDSLAEKINTDLADKNPVVLCVLNGAIVMTGKLLPRLTIPLTLDSINASRYQNKTFGRGIEWLYKPRTSLQNRTVLLVDDILDEGITLKALRDYCLQDGATEVYSVVLIEKTLEHVKPLTADFVGLTIPNQYIFGYGMDYKGYGRNANGIYACTETF